MSFFNDMATTKTTNMENFPSYGRLDFRADITALIFSQVNTTDRFYESYSDILARLQRYVESKPSEVEFIAKTMVYARTELNLRTITHWLAFTIAFQASGNSYLRKAYYQILIRPDDALEIISIFNKMGHSIPNALRRAIRDRLENSWDLYTFRKYQCIKCKVKLSDLVKLTHPNPEVWWNNFGEKYERLYLFDEK